MNKGSDYTKTLLPDYLYKNIRQIILSLITSLATYIVLCDFTRMNLRDCLEIILSKYSSAISEKFAAHDLAYTIRSDIPKTIKQYIEEPERYLIQASAGQGNWARSPWIALFDILVTNTAQSGYYPVYLFKEDFSGLYLSLNQGVTEIREKYKSNAKKALQTKAADFRAQIGGAFNSFPELNIDLCASASANLSSYYEVGNICAKLYAINNLPSDSELAADLREILSLYEVLSYNETVPNSSTESEEDEHNYYVEDLRKFRQHKRIERNIRLAKEVKRIQGTVCQVCKTSFEEVYGLIGQGYIEAHHLTPLADLKEQKILLDPKKDFAVLCANCHRMIHRCEFPHDVERFSREHYQNQQA